jgi:filamentous hemagglutinin
MGLPAPGTNKAKECSALLRNNGFDVVGEEIEVAGPLGVRRYDLIVRDQKGALHGIEIKSGGATKTTYQEFTDYFVNRFGADGRGKLDGEKVVGAITVYVP